MSLHLEKVERLLRGLERFSVQPADYEGIYHPAVVQIEYPNLLTRHGRERSLDGLREGMSMAGKILSRQKYDVKNHFAHGAQLVLEVEWSGEMAVASGSLKKGQLLKAHVCMVFEFREGLIYRQRNYDCYEPWAEAEASTSYPDTKASTSYPDTKS